MMLRALLLLALALPALADDGEFRMLSWNVSGNAFDRQPAVFGGLMAWADADIVLLDEVSPHSDIDALPALMRRATGDDSWFMHSGDSGGRQRGIILSRLPSRPVPSLSAMVPYPADEKGRLTARMSQRERDDSRLSMEHGIPVNAAMLDIGNKRLLVVITDLQCCGNDPESWQEDRRRVEARVIRERIRETVENEKPDGLILAGDFNLVNGAFALSILGGPFGAPVHGLSQAEVYHLDGTSTWTWDGRGMPFPNGTLDFQLYSGTSLDVVDGMIMDTEQADPDTLERHGLAAGDMMTTGRHRPLLVEYRWRPALPEGADDERRQRQ